MSLATTSDSALLYDELEARGEVKRYEQAEGTGWAMRNLGFGAASAIGAWIAAATSLAVPFLISAVVISVSVLFVVFFLHEPHFEENKKKTPWFKAIKKVASLQIWERFGDVGRGDDCEDQQRGGSKDEISEAASVGVLLFDFMPWTCHGLVSLRFLT